MLHGIKEKNEYLT